jgi:hypothetical protein
VRLENFGSFAFFAFARCAGKMQMCQNVGWQSVGIFFVGLFKVSTVVSGGGLVTYNVLQLPEGRDFYHKT